MKKVLFILMMMLISGCGGQKDTVILSEPVPYQSLPAHAEGIFMALEEDIFYGTPEKMHVTLLNDSREVYHYGAYYQLEYKKDGMWHIVPYRENIFAKYPDFKNTGKLLEPNEGIEQNYLPEDLDLKLAPGNYRLVKTFIHSSDDYTVSVAVPFTIR